MAALRRGCRGRAGQGGIMGGACRLTSWCTTDCTRPRVRRLRACLREKEIGLDAGNMPAMYGGCTPFSCCCAACNRAVVALPDASTVARRLVTKLLLRWFCHRKMQHHHHHGLIGSDDSKPDMNAVFINHLAGQVRAWLEGFEIGRATRVASYGAWRGLQCAQKGRGASTEQGMDGGPAETGGCGGLCICICTDSGSMVQMVLFAGRCNAEAAGGELW